MDFPRNLNFMSLRALEMFCILIQILLRLVPEGSTDYKSALVQTYYQKAIIWTSNDPVHQHITYNLYKTYQIRKLKYFSSHLAVAFVQSIEASF